MDSVFACGFEEGVAGVHWTLLGASFDTTNPISGLRSLRCNPSNQTNFNALTVASFGAGLLIIRCKALFTTLPDISLSICSLGSDAGTGVLYGNGALFAYSNAFQGQVSVPVTTGIIYAIDVKIDKRANPWKVDVQVNGVPCSQSTSATAASTAAEQLRIGMQPGTPLMTADVLFDDVTISTTEDDHPIGPGFVHPFVPTADGTHNIAGAADFKRGSAGTDITNASTDSFDLIDNIPMDAVGSVPTADDYINAIAPFSSTDYTEHVFGPAPGIPVPTAAPRAVDVMVETAQAATQTGSFKLALNDNDTLDTVAEQSVVAGNTAVAAASKHYALAPTGGPWVVGGGGNGDFNDLRIRFFSADANPDQYFVAAMIEAEFNGPLFTSQALAIGADVSVSDDLTVELPASYNLSNTVSETVDTVVNTLIASQSAEGEVPQQQAIIESQGGDEVGNTFVSPGARLHARMRVTGAGTNVGLDRGV